MENEFSKNRIALAVIAAIGTFTTAPTVATAAAKTPGQYVAGDFHNHTTCSDGSTSMQKKVKKSMDRDAETPWGLDWFVQAGHGGTGNRNCTLVEDATLATPAYPYLTGPTPYESPPARTRSTTARKRAGRKASAPPTSRATCPARAPTRTCGAGSPWRSTSTH